MRYRHAFLALAAMLISACPRPGPQPPPPPPPIECPACPATQPDGCKPCPDTPPPPPQPPPKTEGDLDGVARDKAGKALEGARIEYLDAQGVSIGDSIAIGKAQSDRWCENKPAPCSPAPAGYFSKPGKEPFGRYVLRATLSDGRVANSEPIIFGKDWRSAIIAFDVPPPKERPLGAIFSPDRLMLDLSYYNVFAFPPEVRELDFIELAAADFDVIEAWFIWDRTPGASVLDERGRWLPGGADRVKALLDQLQRHGLYLSGRVSACHLWKASTHDSASTNQITRSIASRPDIANHPAFLLFDYSNESENSSKPPGKRPGLGFCHTSAGQTGVILREHRKLLPKIRGSLSISGPIVGTPTEGFWPIAHQYCEMKKKGATFDAMSPLLPHFERKSESGTRTESHIRLLRSEVGKCQLQNVPILLVEEFRDNHTPPNYRFPLSQYQAAIQGSVRGDAKLWCLHNGVNTAQVGKGVWYDPQKPLIPQLNETQRAVIKNARAWAQAAR